MVELTAGQRAVVEHEAGALTVSGGPGTGRTTALVHRYLHLTQGAATGRVVVVSRSRETVDAFRAAVLPHLRGAAEALPVSTAVGLAFSILRASGRDVRLLVGGEQWAVVRDLLAQAPGDEWLTLRHYANRRAFVDEVADAVVAWRAAGMPALEGRWSDLATFAHRYAEHLDRLGALDVPGVLAAAAATEAGPAVDHLLVDDADALSVVGQRLIATLAAGAKSSVLVERADAAGDVLLDQQFRSPERAGIVCCSHPSTEPDVVAAELLERRAAGVGWSDMAVVVRRSGERVAAISRGLLRHGIPVQGRLLISGDEPVLRSLSDVLALALGDDGARLRLATSPFASSAEETAAAARDVLDRGGDALAVAHVVFRGLAASLVPDPDGPGDPGADRLLDILVAVADGLEEHVGRHPSASFDGYLELVQRGALTVDGWRATAGRTTDAVTVVPVAAAAGREWDTVIVAGCVEGDFPRVTGAVRCFDRALLDQAAAGAPSRGERRRQSLAEERRVWALATSRARRWIVVTAAPEPGVLLSRFVEGWPRRSVRLPAPPPVPPGPAGFTESAVPWWPEGKLTLSASQLTTFADCPLKYAYSYALRVRGDAGIWADFGTLVHEILARFLGPEDRTPRTWERLVGIAEECWSDDVAPFRPQREEARRDLFSMLAAWWEAEGSAGNADVLEVEYPFDVEVAGHTVVGKIDRVDRYADGIQIADYKTGRRKLRPSELADDIQLATYHLAASRDPHLAAYGPPRRLRLSYLRSGDELEQAITADHDAWTEDRIAAAASAILAEVTEPSVTADCDHCDFHRLCPLQAEGREVAAR